jgi:hypothetical protein
MNQGRNTWQYRGTNMGHRLCSEIDIRQDVPINEAGLNLSNLFCCSKKDTTQHAITIEHVHMASEVVSETCIPTVSNVLTTM